MLPFTDPDSWKSRWLRLFLFSAALAFLFSFKLNNQQQSRFALCSFCIFVYACLRIVPAYFHIVRSQFSFTLFLISLKKDRNEKKINLISMKFIFSFAYPQPSAKASETVSRLHSDTYVEFIFHKICKQVKTFLNKPHCCAPCQ